MLTLYHFESCPFCHKVRQALEDMGVRYISVPAPRGSKNREEMVALGGKEQVPFLVDPEKNTQMYESDDIIKYVQEHYS